MNRQNAFQAVDIDETPTPIHSTSSYPVYQNCARELANKVLEIGTPYAIMKYEELRWYEEQFSSWSPTNRPDDAKRTKMINQFIDLFREVHHFTSQNRKNSSVMPRNF